MNMDFNTTNEVITLSLIVGYCLSSLNNISDHLSNNEPTKASTKIYEAIKFIKDKTTIYNNVNLQIPGEDLGAE